MEPIFISLFGALCLYMLILWVMHPSEKQSFQRRMKKLMDVKYLNEEQAYQKKPTKTNKQKQIAIRWISKEFANAVETSGVKLTANEYLSIWLGTTFIPMVLLLLLKGNVLTVIGVGIVGFLIPPLFLHRAKIKRQDLFTKQLGEALIVIGNSIKAGFSFRQSLESVVKDMPPPISSEFEITIRELRYGASLEDALNHMSARVKNADLDLFISAVLTSAQVGSNLSDILDTISATIRDRIRIKQEVKVLTSSGRLSAIIIGLLPVFIILVIMLINPTYLLGFFHSTIGKIMLSLSIFLEIIGFTIIRKIADIDY